MGEKLDDAKGRAKEAVGDLTDDEELKREGKADQAGGKVKGVIGNIADKADDLVEKVKDKVHRD